MCQGFRDFLVVYLHFKTFCQHGVEKISSAFSILGEPLITIPSSFIYTVNFKRRLYFNLLSPSGAQLQTISKVPEKF